jgi:2-oxoglutarate dehydrogenase E2 component (dihydrolipoamide succinyltransferase)
MSREVKVPVLPESVEDAVISAWHKKPGDSVNRDENLVDLETDKVVLEVPSPVDGVVGEVKVQEGDTVTSGQVLAILEERARSTPTAEAESPGKPTEESVQPASSQGPAQVSETEAAEAGKEHDRDKASLSPSARRLAEEEAAADVLPKVTCCNFSKGRDPVQKNGSG